MKKASKKIFRILFVTFIVFPTAFLIFFYITYNNQISFIDDSFIEIYPGETLNDVIIDLKDRYDFDHIFKIKFIMKCLFLEKNIKPGIHNLSNISTIKDLSSELTSVTSYASITLLEGWAINDIAQYLSNHDDMRLIDKEIFKQKCSDVEFINDELVEKMDFYNVNNLEGFLFPETYLVDSYVSEEDLLKIFIQEYLKQIKPYKKEIKDINQTMIIASIIEAETNNVNEMDTISAVYNNRIKKGMLLQADPTVLYYMTEDDLKKFKNSKPGTRVFGNVWKKYKKMNNPYNTYKYMIPPGPINSPRIQAIEAALNPAKIDYLFMVMNNRLGKHLFAKHEKEHLDNIKRN